MNDKLPEILAELRHYFQKLYIDPAIPEDEANQLIAQAEQFLELAQRLLGDLPDS